MYISLEVKQAHKWHDLLILLAAINGRTEPPVRRSISDLNEAARILESNMGLLQHAFGSDVDEEVERRLQEIYKADRASARGQTATWFRCRFLPLQSRGITVRIISAKNGHPIVEQHLQLGMFAPSATGTSDIFSQSMYTDTDGLATFHVPFQIPVTATVVVAGLTDYCSPAAYHADEVLQAGAAVARPCPYRPLKKFFVQPTPGEIVIYVGEYTRWERALYFPWHS